MATTKLSFDELEKIAVQERKYLVQNFLTNKDINFSTIEASGSGIHFTKSKAFSIRQNDINNNIVTSEFIILYDSEQLLNFAIDNKTELDVYICYHPDIKDVYNYTYKLIR